MSMLSQQGILNPLNLANETVDDLSAYTRQVFINEFPLITRADTRPVGGTTFQILNSEPRPRKYALAADAIEDDTTVTLADASPLLNGDELLIGSERLEVVEVDPVTGLVGVARGVAGTTAAAHAIGDNIRLMGNSRHGDEVDQAAHRMVRSVQDQYVQTWQFPVQVGGLANALNNVRLPSGDSNLFNAQQKSMLIEMMRDREYSSYYGAGQAPTMTLRAKQKGLRSLIDQDNVTVAPANGAGYRSEDLIRDLVQVAVDGGGEPDIIMCSTNFLTGLTIWGQAAQQIQAGGNVFGTPVKVLETPFLAGMLVIPSYQLEPYTAIALTSRELYWGNVRGDSWKPRGSRGDAVEGDWISSGAIALENPRHHAWLEGITAFSA